MVVPLCSALVIALSLSEFKKPVDNALRDMVGFLGCLYRAWSWTQTQTP